MNEHSMPRKVQRWQVVAEFEARQRDPFLRRLARKFARRGGTSAAKVALRPGALPEAMLDLAYVPGFEGARTWGDVFTPAFEEVIIDKNRQVVAAAEAGVAPDGIKVASFLALSGGGDKGAFAAGLLGGWGERGDRPNFEVVTGVSAGALAAPFAFINRDRCLEEIYTKYGAGHLFKSRGIRGYFSDALNDTSRLDALIRHYVTELFLDQIAEEHQKGRRLLALTTNIDAQRPVVWALSGIASSGRPDRRDLFVKVLRASSALPGVFPPVKIDVVGPDGRTYNEMHVDGGVTAELVFIPPESRILHLEDMFFKERRRRTLYVVMNGKLGPEYSPIDPKLVPLAQRAVQTLVKYQAVDNLLALALVARTNGSRFLFNAIPPTFNAKPRGLFDRDHAKELFAAGREVGRSGKWFNAPPSSPSVLPDQIYDLDSDTTAAVAATSARPSCRLRSPIPAEDAATVTQSA